MKKSILCGISALLMLGAVSCSDSKPMYADEAIAFAEKVELDEGTVLGALPSIAEQCKTAQDSLNSMSIIIYEEIGKAHREHTYNEKTVEKVEQMKTDFDSARVFVDAYFQREFDEVAAKFEGKTLACENDEKVAASSKFVIAGFDGMHDVIVDYTFRPANEGSGMFRLVGYGSDQKELTAFPLNVQTPVNGNEISGTEKLSIEQLKGVKKLVLTE